MFTNFDNVGRNLISGLPATIGVIHQSRVVLKTQLSEKLHEIVGQMADDNRIDCNSGYRGFYDHRELSQIIRFVVDEAALD